MNQLLPALPTRRHRSGSEVEVSIAFDTVARPAERLEVVEPRGTAVCNWIDVVDDEILRGATAEATVQVAFEDSSTHSQRDGLARVIPNPVPVEVRDACFRLPSAREHNLPSDGGRRCRLVRSGFLRCCGLHRLLRLRHGHPPCSLAQMEHRATNVRGRAPRRRGVPDPELIEQAKRRKVHCDVQAGGAGQSGRVDGAGGRIGELLRRCEGLYTSHLIYGASSARTAC